MTRRAKLRPPFDLFACFAAIGVPICRTGLASLPSMIVAMGHHMSPPKTSKIMQHIMQLYSLLARWLHAHTHTQLKRNILTRACLSFCERACNIQTHSTIMGQPNKRLETHFYNDVCFLQSAVAAEVPVLSAIPKPATNGLGSGLTDSSQLT